MIEHRDSNDPRKTYWITLVATNRQNKASFEYHTAATSAL